jgi:hypothetical protein
VEAAAVALEQEADALQGDAPAGVPPADARQGVAPQADAPAVAA